MQWKKNLSPLTVASLVILAIAILWALVPGLFTNQNPIQGGDTPALLAPSGEHWFGTDPVGRDLYTRVVYGARQSLLGALLAVLFGLVVGTILGVIAGVNKGVVDSVIMRVVDVFLSIPSLLLSLTVIMVLGHGTFNAAIAVGVTSVATFARLARSQVLAVAASDYVEAAYGSGASPARVLFRHVLPNPRRGRGSGGPPVRPGHPAAGHAGLSGLRRPAAGAGMGAFGLRIARLHRHRRLADPAARRGHRAGRPGGEPSQPDSAKGGLTWILC